MKNPVIAITLFGHVFYRDRRGLTPSTVRHELIHVRQQREWLYLPFFIIYLAEWLLGFIRTGSWHRAYRSVSFEREAYSRQDDPTYLSRRPRFANFRR